MTGRSRNITFAAKVLVVLMLVTVGLMGAAPQGVFAQARGQGEGPQDKGAAQQEDPCVEKAKKAQQEAKAEEEQAAKDAKNAAGKARDEAEKRRQGAQRKGNAARKAEDLCKKGERGEAESILRSLNEIAGARDELHEMGMKDDKKIDEWLEQLNNAARESSTGAPTERFIASLVQTILRAFGTGSNSNPESTDFQQAGTKLMVLLRNLWRGEGKAY